MNVIELTSKIKLLRDKDISYFIDNVLKKELLLEETFFINLKAGQCRTLNHHCIGHDSRTGWTLYARIHEDYYKWIEDFIAVHEKKGYVVAGNFETEVYANSGRAYSKFLLEHKVEEWNARDV